MRNTQIFCVAKNELITARTATKLMLDGIWSIDGLFYRWVR